MKENTNADQYIGGCFGSPVEFIAGLSTFSSCHRHRGVTFLRVHLRNKTLVPLRNLVQKISLGYHTWPWSSPQFITQFLVDIFRFVSHRVRR